MKYLFIVLLVIGCTTPDMPDEEETDDNDSATTEIEVEDTGEVFVNDAGDNGSTRYWRVSLESCSVSVLFHFADNLAESVEFKNYNDRSVVVEITNNTTGGVVVSNCLWPENSIFGGEDSEEVHFDVDDTLELTIKLGNGDWASTTCIDEFDEYLNLFDDCSNSALGFVYPF